MLYCYDNPSGRRSRRDLRCGSGPCRPVHSSSCRQSHRTEGVSIQISASASTDSHPRTVLAASRAGRAEPSRERMALRSSTVPAPAETYRAPCSTPALQGSLFSLAREPRAAHLRSLCRVSSRVYQRCGSQVATSWAQGPSSIRKPALLVLPTALRLSR